jgi:hypothetical protein
LRVKIPTIVVDLICERGHVTHAWVSVPLGVDSETGEYNVYVGDDWAFTDCCDPCENFDTCLDSDNPCELCLKGWRSEASQEAGRAFVFSEVERLYVRAMEEVGED